MAELGAAGESHELHSRWRATHLEAKPDTGLHQRKRVLYLSDLQIVEALPSRTSPSASSFSPPSPKGSNDAEVDHAHRPGATVVPALVLVVVAGIGAHGGRGGDGDDLASTDEEPSQCHKAHGQHHEPDGDVEEASEVDSGSGCAGRRVGEARRAFSRSAALEIADWAERKTRSMALGTPSMLSEGGGPPGADPVRAVFEERPPAPDIAVLIGACRDRTLRVWRDGNRP